MNATLEPWIEIVRRKVAHMRYGSVQITIHDGRVTQVEATEKTRLPNEPDNLPTGLSRREISTLPATGIPALEPDRTSCPFHKTSPTPSAARHSSNFIA